MKWLFRRLLPASGGPVSFLQSETVVQTKRSQFIAFTRRNSNEFLELFQQPWPGVSPTAILNEEKALGTRLSKSFTTNSTADVKVLPKRSAMTGADSLISTKQ